MMVTALLRAVGETWRLECRLDIFRGLTTLVAHRPLPVTPGWASEPPRALQQHRDLAAGHSPGSDQEAGAWGTVFVRLGDTSRVSKEQAR